MRLPKCPTCGADEHEPCLTNMKRLPDGTYRNRYGATGMDKPTVMRDAHPKRQVSRITYRDKSNWWSV